MIQWHLKLSNWRAYSRLMRMEKPIGIYLLLWPTFWALWIAAEGMPSWHHFIVFSLGVVIMRAAGCVINDYADRDFDGHVERTKLRPIPAGDATAKEALQLFTLLIVLAFALVLTLDIKTILLSFVALLLAASYPFMKRYTHFPQIVLGAAFSWSIPMAFMAVSGELSATVWLLYLANLAWTVAYDTYYAMVDREDDLKIGVKSTAIAFGRYDLIAILLLQIIMLASFIAIGQLHQMSWPFYLALALSTLMFIKQFWSSRLRDRQACFKAFLDNHYVGLAVFLGIAAHYFFV